MLVSFACEIKLIFWNLKEMNRKLSADFWDIRKTSKFPENLRKFRKTDAAWPTFFNK